MGLQVTFTRIFLLMILFVWVRDAQGQLKVFNVMNYGAIANGQYDNSEALGRAWNEACHWKGTGVVLIPRGTYMVHPVKFQGPCSGRTMFLNTGEVLAPTDPALIHADNWIAFQEIDGLRVSGGGSFNGQGEKVWHDNDCHKNGDCKPLSSSLSFKFVTNGRIDHITSINSKMFHFNIYDNQKIRINHVKILAPAESPNTDGIHIGRSNDIRITNSEIRTGDDCISLKQGSRDIHIQNVQCGPGHGISVGSLGKDEGEEEVRGITVRNCTFQGSDNGLRIKTWAASTRNIASDFTFEDIVVENVRNPINIDQEYCPHPPCNEGESQVEIKNVKFRNIRGTSSTKVAVSLICSSRIPCSDIELHNIDLVYHDQGGPATSSCRHVNGVSSGVQRPPSCI
ncbi:exopolygalacturonase-like [Vitis riparia]|uniref:exopolygalacturonase-like n=1 Tax=Vitis riparia TaxID=96939 RepID=UPI00155A3D61|nr:exopolygalacturonase-like [Vitis riparia]